MKKETATQIQTSLLILLMGINGIVNVIQNNEIKKIKAEQKMVFKKAIQEQIFQLKMNRILHDNYNEENPKTEGNDK